MVAKTALLELFPVGILTLLCVNHETCRSCCSFTSSPSSFFRRTHNVGNGAARSRSLRGAHREEYNQNDHSDRDEGSIIGGWSFVFSDVLKKLGKNRATEPLIAGRPSLSCWRAEFVDAANRVQKVSPESTSLGDSFHSCQMHSISILAQSKNRIIDQSTSKPRVPPKPSPHTRYLREHTSRR